MITPRRLLRVVAGIPAALVLFAGISVAQSTLNVPSMAYPTIQSAVDAAAPGDTVLIGSGTFTSVAPGSAVVRVQNKTDLTIQGAGTTATIIDCEENYGGGIFVLDSSDVTIRDLTVRNMNRQGVVCFQSDLITIQDVRAQGLGAATVSPQGVVYGFSILDTADVVIDDVTVEDCSGGGFQFTGGSIGCSLSDFVIINSAGVNGFAAIAYDTFGGQDVPGGAVAVAISGVNTIIGCPVAFLFLDSPLGPITTSLTGSTSVFGVISEVNVVGAGTIVGLDDYVTGLGLQYAVSGGSAAVPSGVAYFSSLANAAIGVMLAPNPETAVISELGTDTLFVAPGMRIQTVVDAAAPGDTICILPGTYTATSGGSVVDVDTDDLTIKGLDRDLVIIDSLGSRNYVIYVDGASGVTISDLTVQGANFEHLTGVDADELTVSNVRVAGGGQSLQGVSGRIHGVVLNSGSTGAEIDGLIADDLSGAGFQLSPGGEAVLSDFTFTDVAGNLGFGAVSVYVAGGISIPDGNSTLQIEGDNAIVNTAPGGTGILLGDSEAFVLTFRHLGTTTFTNVFLPLARFGNGCIPLIDDTAVGMGLPWRVTGGEPAIPNGSAWLADQATANLVASLATQPGNAVVEEVFAQPLPGSGEDFDLLTFVNGVGDGTDPVKSADTATDLLTVVMESPCDTFFGAIPVLVVQFWQDMSPPSNAIYPFVHLQIGNAQVIFDGGASTPFGPTLLGHQPIALTFSLPPVLAGYVGRIQALVLGPQAENGIFAGSNAHEITFF